MPANGLTTLKSAHSAAETMARLQAAVTGKGMTVFAHVDHAAEAAKVGMNLRPTDLLIFGGPKGGTPAMQLLQSLAIDLPLKALVWQDEAGAVWLSTNDPAWLVERHGGSAEAKAAVQGMAAALAAVAAEAIGA